MLACALGGFPSKVSGSWGLNQSILDDPFPPVPDTVPQDFASAIMLGLERPVDKRASTVTLPASDCLTLIAEH